MTAMLKKIGLILLFTFGSGLALAQGTTTAEDGGHGVLCSGVYRGSDDRNLTPFKLELLDFYEARNAYGAMPRDRGHLVLSLADVRNLNSHVCVVLRNRMRRMERILGQSTEVANAFRSACGLAYRVKWVGTIESTQDQGNLAIKLPKNCEIVQIGKRHNGRVILNDQMLPGMTVNDIGGLLLHESSHPYFDGNKSTLAVRQFVMFAFARESFLRKNRHLLEQLIQTRRPIEPARFNVE